MLYVGTINDIIITVQLYLAYYCGESVFINLPSPLHNVFIDCAVQNLMD